MTDPAANVRAAFRDVSLGLMSWEPPPLMGAREYRRLELLSAPITYRPWDPQGEVEPFDVQADWEENHS